MGALRHMSFYSYVVHFLLVSHLNRKICLSLNQGLFEMQKEALHRRFSTFPYRGGLLQQWVTSLPTSIPDLDLRAKGQHMPECGGRENWKWIWVWSLLPSSLSMLRREQHFRAVGVFLRRCQGCFREGSHSLTANWGGNKNKGMEVSQLYWRHLIT